MPQVASGDHGSVGDGRAHGLRRQAQPRHRPAWHRYVQRRLPGPAAAPGPRARSVAVPAGRGAGQLQEDVIQRGSAQPDVADADLCLAQPGGRLLHQLEPIARGREGEPVRALVRLGLAAAHPGEDRLRPVPLPHAGQFDLQDLAADPVLELVPGSLRDHLPPVDDGDPVGQLIGFLQVLGGQQERCSLALQLAHDRPDLVAAARIQARSRLVEEQHLRAGQQARRDVEPATHAAGVGPGRPVGRLGQVEPLQQLAGAAAGLLTRQLEQASEHLQVLPPGQQLVNRRELPRQADQLADSGRLTRHVVAEDLRPARIRRQQCGQDPDQRGLARPVRAQQAEHHPCGNLEPGTIQRHGRPEALDHALNPHRRHGSSNSVHLPTIDATGALVVGKTSMRSPRWIWPWRWDAATTRRRAVRPVNCPSLSSVIGWPAGRPGRCPLLRRSP